MKNLSLFALLLLFSFLLNGQTTFGPQQLIDTIQQTPTTTTTTTTTTDVKTADIDNDGDQDVICSSGNLGDVAWYENLGNGIFGNKIIISNSFVPAYQLQISDFNKDGFLDIISVNTYYNNPSNALTLFKNNGNKTFAEMPINQSVLENATTLFVANLDGDDDDDILIGTHGTGSSDIKNKVVWYENLGDNNFNERVINEGIIGSGGTTSIFAADMDNDGDQDVVVSLTDNMSWYENDGNGNFNVRNVVTTSIYFTINIYVVDFDNDGDMDILSTQSEKVVWYENLGEGVFTEEILIGDNNIAGYLSTADLDNDNDIDVLLGASPISVPGAYFLNNGNGTFDTAVSLGENGGVGGIVASDLDNDGDQDILYASYVGVLWFENLFEGDVINSTINDNAFSSEISIYPNPFSDYTTINFEQPIDVDLKLFNSAGSVVRQYQSFSGTELIIEKKDLPTGIYFLNFYEKGKQELLSTQKLVVH